jgi:hypothetical protein
MAISTGASAASDFVEDLDAASNAICAADTLNIVYCVASKRGHQQRFPAASDTTFYDPEGEFAFSLI